MSKHNKHKDTATGFKAKELALSSSMSEAEAEDAAIAMRRAPNAEFAIVGGGSRAGALSGAVSLDSIGVRHSDLLSSIDQHPALATSDESSIVAGNAGSLVGQQPDFVPDYALAFAASGGLDSFSVSRNLAIAANNGYKQLALIDAHPYKQQERQNGRVIQNWTQPIPIAPGMPILEIVTNRIARSLVSYRYYLSDGVAGPAIDTLSEFPLNRGFDIQAVYNSDDMPTWFDPDWVDADSLVDAYGENRVSTVVASWVTAKCEALAEELNLVYQMVDLQKEAYIHGDSFIYRVDDIEDQKYKKDHSRVYPDNTIADLQGLNPTAVWLSRDATGITDRIVVIGQPGVVIDELEMDNTIHLKHRGSSFTTYGFPHLARAFKDLMLKESYQDAATAWAQRYTIPIRMLTYGVLVRGGQNAGPIATPIMRAAAEAAVQQYDPKSGQVIVAPFHWEYKFIGADGNQAMLASNELMEANRRIMAALDIPSAFLYGDWTNYATARIQYSALMHRLKVVQESLRRILEKRIFAWFCTIRGYVDNLGQPIKINVRWKRAHLEDDQSFMELIGSLAKIPGFLSMKTSREAVGFDNDTEIQNLADENDHAIRLQQQAEKAGVAPPVTPGSPPISDKEKATPTAKPKKGPSKDSAEEQSAGNLQRGYAAAQQALSNYLSNLPQYVEVNGQELTVAALNSDEPFWRTVRMRHKQLRAVAHAYELRLAELYDKHGSTRPVGDVGSMMVSFCIDEDISNRLAMADKTSSEKMHITVAYVKNANGDDVKRAHQAVIKAAQKLSAGTASVEGIGRFPATDNSNNQDVLYAKVTGLDFTGFRASITQALGEADIEVADDFSGYTPHITLAYVDPSTATPQPHFTKVDLKLGCIDVVGAGRHIHTVLKDEEVADNGK